MACSSSPCATSRAPTSRKLVAEEGALEPRRALELLSQVAEALDAAHEKGLVHRDVKPSNVLIAEAAGREHCYLGDFGLTKRTGSLSGVSVAGEIVGTLEYVAPEQITGNPLDERSDVYSLGCVLYECLTGPVALPARDRCRAPLGARPRGADSADSGSPRPAQGARHRPRPRTRQGAGAALPLGRRADRRDPVRATARRRRTPCFASRLVGPSLSRPRSRSSPSLAIAAFLLTRDSGGLSSVSPNSVGVIDPSSNELVAEVPVGIDPQAITTGLGGVWVTNVEDETVSRIDPTDTTARAATIAVDDYPSDVTIGAGSCGSLSARSPSSSGSTQSRTRRRHPRRRSRARRRAARRARASRSAAGTSGSSARADAIGRIDATTSVATSIGWRQLLTSSSSVLPQFSDVAYGLDSLWIVNSAGNKVVEVDPLTTRSSSRSPSARTRTRSRSVTTPLWVANFEDDTVHAITIPEQGQTADDLGLPGRRRPRRRRIR